MDRQFTLRVPADLAAQVDRAAKRLRRRRSEVVRLALEHFLSVQVETPPIDAVRDLLGVYESGVPDLGQRHREYLLSRLRSAR